MGKGITVSTMAKSIKVIMHFVFIFISKTHFHLGRQGRPPIFSQGNPRGKRTASPKDGIGSKDGEEICSREH